MKVWVAVSSGERGLEVNGVFGDEAKAAAICTTANDAVVPFDLDADYRAERTFNIVRPTEGTSDQVTA